MENHYSTQHFSNQEQNDDFPHDHTRNKLMKTMVGIGKSKTSTLAQTQTFYSSVGLLPMTRWAGTALLDNCTILRPFVTSCDVSWDYQPSIKVRTLLEHVISMYSVRETTMLGISTSRHLQPQSCSRSQRKEGISNSPDQLRILVFQKRQ